MGRLVERETGRCCTQKTGLTNGFALLRCHDRTYSHYLPLLSLSLSRYPCLSVHSVRVINPTSSFLFLDQLLHNGPAREGCHRGVPLPPSFLTGPVCESARIGWSAGRSVAQHPRGPVQSSSFQSTESSHSDEGSFVIVISVEMTPRRIDWMTLGVRECLPPKAAREPPICGILMFAALNHESRTRSGSGAHLRVCGLYEDVLDLV